MGGIGLGDELVDCILRNIANKLLVESGIWRGQRRVLEEGIGISVVVVEGQERMIRQGKGGGVNVHGVCVLIDSC